MTRDGTEIGRRGRSIGLGIVLALLAGWATERGSTFAQAAAEAADAAEAAEEKANGDEAEGNENKDGDAEKAAPEKDAGNGEGKKDAGKESDDDKKAAAAKVAAQVSAAVAAVEKSVSAQLSGAGEKSEAEAKTKDGEEQPAKAKKKRDPPMFRMRDGTRIAGRVELSELTVTTVYGVLAIPVEELVRVRFSERPDPEREERIRELVDQLGSDEYDLREEASEELARVGLPALELLREAAKSEDQEVKTRAEKLVGDLEEELEEQEDDERTFLVPLRGNEDEIMTLRFTVLGRVDRREFGIKTSYGELKLSRDDIMSIVFREPPYLRKSFKIGGSKAFAANGKWIDTGIEVAAEAPLKIIASGTINLSNYGQNAGPEGTPNVSGNQLEKFAAGALVAKIGDKGKPFLVGSEYEGAASGSGKLFLGVSLKSGSVKGTFAVEVQVKVDEDED